MQKEKVEVLVKNDRSEEIWARLQTSVYRMYRSAVSPEAENYAMIVCK